MDINKENEHLFVNHEHYGVTRWLLARQKGSKGTETVFQIRTQAKDDYS